jgi:hypothetical protein
MEGLLAGKGGKSTQEVARQSGAKLNQACEAGVPNQDKSCFNQAPCISLRGTLEKLDALARNSKCFFLIRFGPKTTAI